MNLGRVFYLNFGEDKAVICLNNQHEELRLFALQKRRTISAAHIWLNHRRETNFLVSEQRQKNL